MIILNREDLLIAIEKHERRRKAFQDAGLSESEAWDLAETMFERDHDPLDDRRLCFECKNFKVQDKKCLDPKQKIVLPFILQRCDGFNLKGVKK
jgi:hypothetical protein